MKSKCCNEELLTIYLDGAQQGLGHPYCSKCGKVDRVMTTTPQLSKELEKAFDEKFKHDFRDGGSSSCYGGKDCDCWVKDAKQFLAQALQDQRLLDQNKTKRTYCEVCHVFIDADTEERKGKII